MEIPLTEKLYINNTNLYIQNIDIDISKLNDNEFDSKISNLDPTSKSLITTIQFKNNKNIIIKTQNLNNFDSITSLFIFRNINVYLILLRCSTLETIIISNNEFNLHEIGETEVTEENKCQLYMNYFLLAHLPKLKTLKINKNNICKISSNIFMKLPELKTLDLSENKLTYIIDTLFTNFSKLFNLKTLNLSHNELTDINNILFTDLPKLKTLNLSHNKISNINDTLFSGLLELQTLNLSHNKLTDINNILFNDLSKLQILNLSDNNISDINTILSWNLYELVSLNLNNNGIRFRSYRSYFKTLLLKFPKLIDLQITDPQLKNIFQDVLTEIILFREQYINTISHINSSNCNNCIIKNDLCNDTRKEFITKCLPFYNLSNSSINVLNYNLSSYIYYDVNNTSTYYLDKNFYLIELPNYNDSIANSIKIYNLEKYNKNNLLSKINHTTFNNIPMYYLFSDYNTIFNIFIYQITNVILMYDTQLKENKKIKLNLETEINIFLKTDSNINYIDSQIQYYVDRIQNTTDKTEKDLYIKIKQQKEKEKQDIINELKELNKDYYSDIEYYKEKAGRIENKLKLFKTVLNNLFRIDKDKKFISISYKFNIFNISLLCEKYKEIIDLICPNHNIHTNKNKFDIIKDYLKNIFKNFKLDNIYYLIHRYKTNIQGIPDITISKDNRNNDINIDFMNSTYTSKINVSKNTQKNDINATIKQESFMNKIHEYKINDENIMDHIYNLLSTEIIIIHRTLNQINKFLPEFTNLFFMAILSYRFKNKLLNSTWGLNTEYIYKLIDDNSKQLSFDSIIKYEYYNKLCNKYYIDIKPIIYEYDLVTYKNITYGNCMENVILQFLKIIFWNVEKDSYDEEILENIIKPEYIRQIKNFFININNEKNRDFILEWVTFITEIHQYNALQPLTDVLPPYRQQLDVLPPLPPDIQTYSQQLDELPPPDIQPYEPYNFLNKKHNIELNPTFNNLIIALRILTKTELSKLNSIEFIQNIINTINDTYTITVDQTNTTIDKIIVHTNKLYYINLSHNMHGGFQEVFNFELYYIDLLSSTNNNQNFNAIYNLPEKTPIKISNLNAYIFYSFVSDKDNIIYKNYIINYIEPNEIIKYYNILFKDIHSITIPRYIRRYIESNLHLFSILPKDVFKNYDLILSKNMLQKMIDNNLFFNFDLSFSIFIKLFLQIKIEIENDDSTFNNIMENVFIKYISENNNDDSLISLFKDNTISRHHIMGYLDKIIKYNNNIIINILIDNSSKIVLQSIELNTCLFKRNLTSIKHKELLKIIENLEITTELWNQFFYQYDRRITDVYLDLFITNNNYIKWSFENWKSFIIKNEMSIDVFIKFINIITSTEESYTHIKNNSIMYINKIILSDNVNISNYAYTYYSIINLNIYIALILNCDIFNFNDYHIMLDNVRIKFIKQKFKNYLESITNAIPTVTRRQKEIYKDKIVTQINLLSLTHDKKAEYITNLESIFN